MKIRSPKDTKDPAVTRPLKIEHREIGCTQFEVVNNSEYCGKIFIQRQGTTTPAHSHNNKHETFLIWSGRVRMVIDGQPIDMKPGDVLSVERGTVHEFTALESDAVLFEFSTPSLPKDSYFSRDDDWERVNRRSGVTREYEWPF